MAVLLLLALSEQAHPAAGRFEKVSEHCYTLQLNNKENVAAVLTEDGILLVDPPAEPELRPTLDALNRLSPKAVRWVVLTNPRSARSAGALYFAEHGAMLIAGGQLRTISDSVGGADLSQYPWFVFDHQMHLFPSNVEIRIMGVDQRATTGGDVILHIPSDKVLIVGRLYEPARYPEIDASAQGNAGTWADGIKQVIDSVPVLKQAIPPKTAVPPKQPVAPKPVQPKPEIKEPEVTLEEGIAVITTSGEVSNLQNMKDLLSACQKLRLDISKAVKSGRSCENFLDSSRAGIYRVYGNFDSYATQLCVGFSTVPDKP